MYGLDMSAINYLAVIVATLAYFILGAIWFSNAMFAKPWMESLNIKPENVDRSGMTGILIRSFIATFVICLSLAIVEYLVGIFALISGIKLGLLCGIGFIVTTQYINSLFEKRPVKLVMINGGYHVIGITIAAAILAVWH